MPITRRRRANPPEQPENTTAIDQNTVEPSENAGADHQSSTSISEQPSTPADTTSNTEENTATSAPQVSSAPEASSNPPVSTEATVSAPSSEGDSSVASISAEAAPAESQKSNEAEAKASKAETKPATHRGRKSAEAKAAEAKQQAEAKAAQPQPQATDAQATEPEAAETPQAEAKALEPKPQPTRPVETRQAELQPRMRFNDARSADGRSTEQPAPLPYNGFAQQPPSSNGDRPERQDFAPIEGGRRTVRGEYFRRPPQPPPVQQHAPAPVPSAPLQAPTHEISLPMGNLLHLAYNPGYTGSDEARSQLLQQLASESKAGGRARCWNCGSLAIVYDRWHTRSKTFGEVGVAFCEICGVWSVL